MPFLATTAHAARTEREASGQTQRGHHSQGRRHNPHEETGKARPNTWRLAALERRQQGSRAGRRMLVAAFICVP